MTDDVTKVDAEEGTAGSWVGLVMANEPPSEAELERIVAGVAITDEGGAKVGMHGFRGTRPLGRAEAEKVIDGLGFLDKYLVKMKNDESTALMHFAWLVRVDDIAKRPCMLAFQTDGDNLAVGAGLPKNPQLVNGCRTVVEALDGIVRQIAGLPAADAR